MIVIGVDVHKHSLTAVAVDELGRPLAEQTSAVSGEAVLEWADSLQEERLWALEESLSPLRAWPIRDLLAPTAGPAPSSARRRREEDVDRRTVAN